MRTNDYNSKNPKGIELLFVIGVVLVILKLCGVVKWSWIWVICPLWMGAIETIVSSIITLIMVTMIEKSNKHNKHNKHSKL